MKEYFLKLATCKTAILLVLFPILLFGQEEVCLFKSLEDYKKTKCEIVGHFSVNKRTDKDIKMYGGSDYVISSTDKKLLDMVEKYYWFILKNDSLFVNCKQLDLCRGYAYTEQVGNNLFITVPANAKYNTMGQTGAIIIGGVWFGLIGATIAGAASESGTNVKYIYYVLDMKNGKTRRLNKNRMIKLLSFNESLVTRYLNEPYPKSANTQKKYLMEYKESCNSSRSACHLRIPQNTNKLKKHKH